MQNRFTQDQMPHCRFKPKEFLPMSHRSHFAASPLASLHRPALLRRLPALCALGVMFATGVLGAVLARPAQAQLDVQTVVVLDFDVFEGLDPNIGRKAADALAVELQAASANDPVARQRVEVVPRQRVQQVISETTALSPPYTDIIQLRLARATGASSVYSGRVLSARVANNQAARVTVEIIQFEANMGAYANGTVVSQSAVDPFGQADNDLLLDEAINKAVYAGLLDIKRKPYPIGTIQVVTRDTALMNLGSRNGVSRGQVFAVMRDTYRGRDASDRDVVERIKIAECVATRLDVDQASVLLTAGGSAGVKIGDKVRRIYVPFSQRGLPQDTDARVIQNLTADELEAQETASMVRRQEIALQQNEEMAKMAEKMANSRNKKNKTGLGK
jgi:hypothetical protein